jgi:hypothetical protein
MRSVRLRCGLVGDGRGIVYKSLICMVFRASGSALLFLTVVAFYALGAISLA